MTLPAPTLQTSRLRLRPFTSADADALFTLHSSAHVLRYWDSPPWSERARADRFIAACRQMADEGSGARLAMDRLSDGAFIGWCGLTRWNPDYRSASLGYVLDDSAWGHGYATEAARALLQWAFETLDLNRVQAETDTRNAASAHVLEKLGFVREGTLREDCVVGQVCSARSRIAGIIASALTTTEKTSSATAAGRVAGVPQGQGGQAEDEDLHERAGRAGRRTWPSARRRRTRPASRAAAAARPAASVGTWTSPRRRRRPWRAARRGRRARGRSSRRRPPSDSLRSPA